jgi:hypothetical protein
VLRQNFPDGSWSRRSLPWAGEDFGCFGAELHAPAVYWFFGRDGPEVYDKAKKDGTLSALPTTAIRALHGFATQLWRQV